MKIGRNNIGGTSRIINLKLSNVIACQIMRVGNLDIQADRQTERLKVREIVRQTDR